MTVESLKSRVAVKSLKTSCNSEVIEELGSGDPKKGNLRDIRVKANELSFVLSNEDYRLGRVI